MSKIKHLLFFTTLLALAFVFIQPSISSAGSSQASTKVRSCVLDRENKGSLFAPDWRDLRFKFRLFGTKANGVFKTKSLGYYFPSKYRDNSDVWISDPKNGKSIWKSPDALKANGQWNFYPVKISIPIGKRIEVTAIADKPAKDDRCSVFTLVT